MSTREVYEKKLRAQLDEWKAELDVLKAKASNAEANAQLEYEHILAGLKGKHETAKSKLQELERASDDAWEDIKEGLEFAWIELRDAFKSAASRFK